MTARPGLIGERVHWPAFGIRQWRTRYVWVTRAPDGTVVWFHAGGRKPLRHLPAWRRRLLHLPAVRVRLWPRPFRRYVA